MDTPAQDWMDTCCWRCGADDVSPDPDGLLLCQPCRRQIFGTAIPTDGVFQVPHGIYWDGHALDRCWRCVEHHVDPDDELGLCASCREEISDDQGVNAR